MHHSLESKKLLGFGTWKKSTFQDMYGTQKVNPRNLVDLVLQPDNSFIFFCPIIILLNFNILEQGTQFAFELQMRFQNLQEKLSPHS